MRSRQAYRSGAGMAMVAVLVLAAAGCSAAPRTPAAATANSPDRSTVATSTHPASSATSRRPASSPSAKRSPAATPVASVAPSTSAAKIAPPVSSSAAAVSVPAGRTIVLNPGHNGGNAANAAAINRQVPAGFGEYKACDTTGTETNAGYSEHAFNWDVTLRLRSLLQAKGVTVILTRSNDSGIGPCVDERARIGNQPGVAAVVSIHADGAPSSGHGFHVCEDSRQPAGPKIAALSHALTVAVHESLLSSSGMTVSSYLGSNGYYPRDDLAGLNLATVPATFVEIGNMRNSSDAAEQSSPYGRQRIAQSLANGIVAWLAGR